MTRFKCDDDDDDDDSPLPTLEYLSHAADPTELLPLNGGARTRYLLYEFTEELLLYLNFGVAGVCWLLMLTQLQGSVVLVRALFLTTVFHLLFTTGYGLLLCFAPTQEPGGETYSRGIGRLLMFGCSCALCGLLALPLFWSTGTKRSAIVFADPLILSRAAFVAASFVLLGTSVALIRNALSDPPLDRQRFDAQDGGINVELHNVVLAKASRAPYSSLPTF